MKTVVLSIIALSMLLPSSAAADIASPVEYYDGGVSNSLEGIFSIERFLSGRTSILLWGGVGLASAVSQNAYEDYSAGLEAAVEIRYYATKGSKTGVFLGLYQGIGFMRFVI